MPKDDRKRELLESFVNKIVQLYKQKCSSKTDEDFLIDQALTQLNALDKPRIDEGKLAKVMNKNWAINLGENRAKRFNKLAEIIAQKAEEWIK